MTVTDSDGMNFIISPAEWPNIQYTLDSESGEIQQNVVGSFKQLPLRIAWAITIHKSQGLTFDKVIIDAGSAFAFGQVYVALSRCRTLEGISLESPVRISCIYSDMHVADFNDYIHSGAMNAKERLGAEEKGYTYDIYREIFDLDLTCSNLGWVRKIWREKLQDIYEPEYKALLKWSETADQLKKTAETFRQQLTRIESANSEDVAYLNERLNKAAGYFHPQIDDMRGFCSRLSSLEVDNKEISKRLKEALDELLTVLEISCHALELILKGKFTMEEYSRIKTECTLEDRSKARARRLKKIVRQDNESGVVNEDLREKLQEWRTARFKKDNVPAYTIMHQSTLMTIASLAPQTKSELLRIKGFGEERFKKYGEEILAITAEFSKLS